MKKRHPRKRINARMEVLKWYPEAKLEQPDPEKGRFFIAVGNSYIGSGGSPGFAWRSAYSGLDD